MAQNIQLGEHIRRVKGREYAYSKIAGKQKYQRPLSPKTPKTLERLSAKDAGIIQRAYKKGIAVSTIQDHVWYATGIHVSAQAIYAYMKRHGVKREKRDTRIDKGRGKIDIGSSARISITAAWNRGESWQKIQEMIMKAGGGKVGRSTIYAYMRIHGNTDKRRVAMRV